MHIFEAVWLLLCVCFIACDVPDCRELVHICRMQYLIPFFSLRLTHSLSVLPISLATSVCYVFSVDATAREKKKQQPQPEPIEMHTIYIDCISNVACLENYFAFAVCFLLLSSRVSFIAFKFVVIFSATLTQSTECINGERGRARARSRPNIIYW